MTTVINTSTSLHLRVSKSQHIYERKTDVTKTADFNLDKLVLGSQFTGQNVRLSIRPLSKNLPEDDLTLLDKNNT